MLDDKTTIEYIRRAKNGENEAKEGLLEHNVSLVKCIVKRYLGKGVDYDDLFQIACMGFLKAIAGFDESFGVKFSTYAEINAFIEEYTLKNGRQPSVSEVGKEFGLDEAETVFVMGSSKMPLSLYGGADYKDGKERELIETLPSSDDQEDWLDRMLLRGAIEGLPERERKIIVLRYFRDMTQSEVAEKIGVSQVQVSRIENKIIKEFREKLSG